MPGSLQSLAGALSLLVALSAAGLLWLLLRRIRPERPAEAAVHAVYRARAAYFWALVAALAVALALTLGRLPYAAGEAPAPDQVVKVLGRQWSWTFDVGDGEQAS